MAGHDQINPTNRMECTWQMVERDICYFLHEQAEWPCIFGDLNYGHLYALPYWDFVFPEDGSVPEAHLQFISEGCLLIILAMALDAIDGSGNYIVSRLDECRAAVERAGEKCGELGAITADALRQADGLSVDTALNSKLEFVTRTYVFEYFRRTAVDMEALLTSCLRT